MYVLGYRICQFPCSYNIPTSSSSCSQLCLFLRFSCESFCLTNPCDLQALRLLSELGHTCPQGCYFLPLCFFFFHREWGKPCNNDGLLMEAGSEDVVLVIQRSQGCESPQSGTFQLAALLPPGHWLCVTLTALHFWFLWQLHSHSSLMSLASPIWVLPDYWEWSAEVLKAFSVPEVDNSVGNRWRYWPLWSS